MGSSLNDNSIVLEADDPLALYLGSNGLDTSGESNGIRFAFQNANGSPSLVTYAGYPNGSVVLALDGFWVLQAGVWELFIAIGANVRLVAGGFGTQATTSTVYTVAGVLVGDIVTASVRIEDTGGTLAGIESVIAGAGTITVVTNAAVTNNDGVVQFTAFRAI